MFFKYQILCLEFNVNFKIPFFLLVNIKLNEEPENLILLPRYQRKILAVGTDILLKVFCNLFLERRRGSALPDSHGIPFSSSGEQEKAASATGRLPKFMGKRTKGLVQVNRS